MKVSALRRNKAKLPVCPKEESWRQQELFASDPRPEMLCFRSQTLAIARHFFEISSQMGRLPSLLGREFFRARVSHHAIPSFEEQAVFVRDVELCLARLSDAHAEMITLIGLYDFSREEIAGMLRYSRTWVSLRVAEALDSLSEIFLRAGILREDHPDRRQCQVGDRSLPPDVIAAGDKKPCVPVAMNWRPSCARVEAPAMT
jgi:DNA-directed RNA polymerase specialized sigma24 family protein